MYTIRHLPSKYHIWFFSRGFSAAAFFSILAYTIWSANRLITLFCVFVSTENNKIFIHAIRYMDQSNSYLYVVIFLCSANNAFLFCKFRDRVQINVYSLPRAHSINTSVCSLLHAYSIQIHQT